MLHTPLCDVLGIDYPVLCAGMGGVAFADLVAAVSEAGGMGVLGAYNLAAEDLRSEIHKVRSLTSKPFGVDLLTPQGLPADQSRVTIPSLPAFLEPFRAEVRDYPSPPPSEVLTADLAHAQFDVVVDEHVPLVVPALGIPDWLISEAHAHGIKVASIVGSVKHAINAELHGADFIIAQGAEAGGHVGRVGTMVLVPAVADAVNVPVVAAGGIMDGRGIAAALMLGAQAVWMGTRFIATHEAAGIPPSVKEHMLNLSDVDTVVTRCYTGKPNRMIRNRFTEAWDGNEQYLQTMPLQIEMIAPVVGPAREAGDTELGAWPTGQGACLIHSISGAYELTRTLVAEADALLATNSSTSPIAEPAQPSA